MNRDFTPLASMARDWTPDTEYLEGEYVWIDKAICQIVQGGITGEHYSLWPGWDRGSIVFSGFGDSAVRAIVRQNMSENLRDKIHNW